MPNRFELLFYPEDRLVQSEPFSARLKQLQLERCLDDSVSQIDTSKTAAQSWWQRWASGLLHYLTGSTAPRIRRRYDRAGRLYFRVYDPVDQRHYTFDSDQEVRVWLEGRYYQ